MTDSDRQEFLQFLAEHDVPAFIRRAQGVTEAWKSVLQDCHRARTELLEMARMRIGALAETVSHDWDALGEILTDPSDAIYLQGLYSEWQPRLRVAVQPIREPKRWCRSVDELVNAFSRFNSRWRQFADEYDLVPVNELRDGYNKYFVIEKSCAFDSDRIGAEGFVELEAARPADILKEFPLLRIPHTR